MVVAAAPALSGRIGKIAPWDMMTSGADTWIRVCSVERLAAAKVVCARVADIDLVVMQDDEAIYAFERACPHEQADLSLGRVVAGRLFCPRHLASFSLVDGKISAGWPSRDLRCYPVRIADHGVWIDAGPSAPNTPLCRGPAPA